MRSKWPDIGQVLFCIFMEQDEVLVTKTRKKNSANTHAAISEMPTSGDLKSGESLFCTTPHPPECRHPHPRPPPTNSKLLWLRTFYEVLHEIHVIKIHFQDYNDEIIFVSD